MDFEKYLSGLPQADGDYSLPKLRAISGRLFDRVAALLFPEVFFGGTDLYTLCSDFFRDLECGVTLAAEVSGRHISAEQICESVLLELCGIREMLILDAGATLRGDPAAVSVEEIMLCYPGFFAILIHRVANLLFRLGVPMLPRLLSELAHGATGIDIHPGATIGSSFCIDHGTGVVIGETARIGDRVKLYQGVTLGAKSFDTDSDGELVRGKKRHPDIGNDVVIYAGATILGADTVVGDRSVIGGNVWLTSSVPPDTVLIYCGAQRSR